ncbi:MAG: RNA polymerase sigma factor [Sedimentisphaerales bacterium]|nr:RNA polymerase sigma factor [Sedimentisphaerales bacterium]
MDDKAGYAELIRQAQLGDQQSMNELAQLVQGRVSAYVYRLTLNHDLAQDLSQETLLRMVESLKDLKQVEQFWLWLYRTAMGKVQHYFRDKKQQQMIHIAALDKERLAEYASQNHNDGLNSVMRRELSETICQAMARLKFAYRNVLILRCFEQLSYAEIAGLMGCKELRARVLFFRAKHSLKQQIARRGFSKTLLLIALGFFGVITTPTKAASAAGAVSAASLDVGFLATLVGAAGTRLGISIMTAITALALTLSLESFICLLVFLCYLTVCFVVVIYSQ